MTSPDILRGSIRRTLLVLSVPLVCSSLMETLNSIVDALWLGWSGTEGLAAVNISAFPIWMMYAILGVVTTGVNSLLAQKLGESTLRAEARHEADQVASIGMLLGLALSCVMVVSALLWGRDLLTFMAGAGSPLIDLGYCYLGFFFLLAPLYGVTEVLMAILRAYGDTKTPMKAYIVGCTLNVVLDPFLIFGWGPFPRWDVFGAVLASNLSMFVSLLWLIWRIQRGDLLYKFSTSHSLTWDWGLTWGVVRIGAPPALASCTFSFVYMMVTPIISSFGVSSVAALGIGHKLENVTYMVGYGLAMACVTMVGQNVGARQYERATKIAWEGFRLIFGFSSAVAAAYWLVPQVFTCIFSDDPLVLTDANLYLRYMGPVQVFAGVGMLINGIFAGVGQTWPAFVVDIPCALLRIPLAYIATYTFTLGIAGVWLALSLMCGLRGLLMLWLFCAGKWKNAEWCQQEPAVAT